jgi:transcriptional regulator with XRE-family HTH domain
MLAYICRHVNQKITENMTISSRLKQERERLELTQVEMAKQTGIARASQQNYESGKRLPNVEYLNMLHKLGVDILYIITGEKREG